MIQVAQQQRFIYYEQHYCCGVSYIEMRPDGLGHFETAASQMLETHPPVRCPLHGHGVSFSKFRGIDNSFRDDVRILLRRNFPFRQIIPDFDS